MDTIFMNLKYNKTSNPHTLLLNLSDKANLKRSISIIYSIFFLSIYTKDMKQ